MNSTVCMDSTVLKIVQIFVSCPHLLLVSINSTHTFCLHASAWCVTGEKVYQLDDYLDLELSLSWSKSTQRYSQHSR